MSVPLVRPPKVQFFDRSRRKPQNRRLVDTTAPAERRLDWGVALLLVVSQIVLHSVCIGAYGFFRDELYFLACAQRLAAGYVDHPPLSVALLAGWVRVFGDSLTAIRVPVILAGAANIVVFMAITAELGGSARAQAIAGLAALISPVHMVVSHLFAMNGFDVLFWSLATWAWIRAVRTDRLPAWIGLGLLLGFGLLNKISVLWLMAGIGTATLFTPLRRQLTGPGPWLALALSFAIFSPHVFWQVAHGWPTPEFMHNALLDKMSPIPAWAFLATQVVVLNPINAPLWIGTIGYIFSRRDELRPLAMTIAFCTVVAIVLASGRGRPNYLAPAVALVIPIGAVVAERMMQRRRGSRLTPIVLSMTAFGLAVAPLALPMVPPNSLMAFLSRLPNVVPEDEVGPKSPMQGFADMFGWEEMTEAVAKAYRDLPPSDQSQVAIYTQNYGEAAAIDHFGPALGLPPAISRHNNYWLWGPRDWSGRVALAIGQLPAEHAAKFGSVQKVGEAADSLAVPEERRVGIYLLRDLKVPVDQFWREIRWLR